MLFLLHSGSRGTSECSCENEDCEHHVIDDGPNQVNFLATTNEVIEPEPTIETVVEESIEKKNDENCYDELSRVLGSLECTVADRKKIKQADAAVEKNNTTQDQPVFTDIFHFLVYFLFLLISPF